MASNANEPIHSGHFMTSNPHSEIPADDEDEDVEVDVVDVDDANSLSAAQTADKSTAKGSLLKDEDRPVTFYKFGSQKTQSIVIDQSLNKLNKCIRVAYMKMTTPKWKDFKGLKLQWKHRIRLNNVIWRAYYMEFRKPGKRGKTPYCYFSVPDDDMTHTKIEGSLLEGMYWKRRMEAVCAQYKRWRTYNRNRARKKCCRKRENSCGCDKGAVGKIGPVIANPSQPNGQQRSMTPENMSTGNNGLFFDFDDDLDNEFTNQLFEQLNAPFLFPNPKENGAQQCANADIMQPGLLSLQPSIEEIMCTDYPFAADDSLLIAPSSDFVNSLPLSGVDAHSQPPHFSQPGVKLVMSSIPSQLQQQNTVNGKEYGTVATMQLVQCNNRQRMSHHRHPSAPISSSVTTSFFRQPSLTAASHPRPAHSVSVAQPAMPVPVITPNISHPLYSQAAVYEPQQIGLMGGGHQRTAVTTTAMVEQHQMIISNSVSAAEPLTNLHSYASREKNDSGNPPMATKMANQPTQIAHPITSIASSAPSQLLPALNYSILAASTVANVVAQASQIGHISQGGSLLNSTNSWPSHNGGWATNQQETYTMAHPQHHQAEQKSNGLFRPSLATAVRMSSSSPLSTASFSTQSLLSPSAALHMPSSSCAARSLTNLVAMPPQNGAVMGRQSAIALHLQQQPKTHNQHQMAPLIPSLPSTNTGAASVHQFVMSDLSRYLTQQRQSPLGPSAVSPSMEQLHASPLPNGSSRGLRLTMSNAHASPAMASPGGLSPNAPPRYHHPTSAPTPLSAPVLGSFSHTMNKQQTQNAEMHSNLTQNLPTKKSSSVTLPPPISEQTHSPPKKRRGSGSFSGTQRSFNLAKRQKQSQGVETQHNSLFDAIGIETNPSFSARQMHDSIAPQQFAELVSAPSKTSQFPSSTNRWASQNRRHPSADSFRFSSPSLQLPQQQKSLSVTSPQLTNSRRKGQNAIGDFLQHAPHELTDDMLQLSGDSSEMLMATTLLGLSEQIKEEEGDGTMLEEKILTDDKHTFATLGHKRRHHHGQQSSVGAACSSTQSSAPSSSQSEQADSTLHPEERKRILHLHAEKNRRFALKEGFESLVNAIPVVEQTGVKCTNAVVLNRAAQHIKQLKSEQDQQQMKLRVLREKITNMNERIALIQSNLPSSSTGGSRPCEAQSPSMRIQVEQFFEHYKKERSREDYRFWLMGEVLKPIVHSFAEQIHPNASDHDRVLHSLKKWLDTHWNAAVLRPIASDVLVRLATASAAFTDEAALSNYIMNEVRNASSAQ
ncbi:hypothetical protein niasHT_026273 [Heterodera trifolii]|uniref:BHLH domain-containing protein n=1 Tax=Heterodera trifolii TaxID=157864 RepID=A0ABD2JV55_9BILA